MLLLRGNGLHRGRPFLPEIFGLPQTEIKKELSMMKKILVLFGGCSSEYEVSMESARAVLLNIDRERYSPLAVHITREGRWRLCAAPLEDLQSGRWRDAMEGCASCTLSLDRGAPTLLLENGLRRLGFDAAFPILHGKNGEDGTLQGLLELAGIPLIGCGVLASALCMDKGRAHTLAHALTGVRVPKNAVFPQGSGLDAIASAAGELGFPLFVKPVRGGSSLGITRVAEPAGLEAAVKEAFAQDSSILLEEAIPGFEVGCAVLGSDVLETGAPDEIALAGDLFDFTEKYTLKTAEIHCPARIPPEKSEEIQRTAKAIYRALDCRGFARVDLFLTPSGELVFNEVNTIPGLTAHSRYPGMMRAAGLGFPALITRIIELGVGQ